MLGVMMRRLWGKRERVMMKGRMTTPVTTVVVLVMENRSFDHILGWQKRLNPEIDGLTGNECNPLSTTDPHSPLVFVSDDAPPLIPDPKHTIQATQQQVFGSSHPHSSPNPPPMNGFVQQSEADSKGSSKLVMSGYKPEAIPVLTALVHEFAVFDRWFGSVPSSTQPNRLFIHSATAHGLVTSSCNMEFVGGYPQRTIFDSLDDAGLTFGIYYHSFPATLILRRMRQLKYADNYFPYDPTFEHHAKEGKLPNYVFIEPRYFNLPSLPANDDHPPNDIARGQELMKQVYEILRASPQWNESLLLITYDEHGGFYDHVPTPLNVPRPDDVRGPGPDYFEFDRLGIRVPTVLVSPWIEKGKVVHGPTAGPTPSSEYEHSSIPATLKKLFNLPSDFLTKRDAWAATFEGVLSRKTPRTDCPWTLPDAPFPASKELATKSHEFRAQADSGLLSELHEELLLIASHLNGDHKLAEFKNTQTMNPRNFGMRHAKEYVERALDEFLKATKLAKEQGANKTSVILMKSIDERGDKSIDFDIEDL